MQSSGNSHFNVAGRHKRPSPVPIIKNCLLTDPVLSPNSINKANCHLQQPQHFCKQTDSKNLNIPFDFSVSSPKLLSKCDKDICRILGQYLQDLGLNSTVEQLILESGCMFEHPSVTKLRKHTIAGEWNMALSALMELDSLMIKPQGILSMKFFMAEQKYLELLEEGRTLDALDTLRNLLTPLHFNIQRVHQLTFFLVCRNAEDLYKMAGWTGVKERENVVDKLKDFLPASVMLPAGRLVHLLEQAVCKQRQECSFHNTKEDFESRFCNISLVHDHLCSKDSFPSSTSQVLTAHHDEVWFVQFSPDGKMLASGCKDGSLIIYDVDLETKDVSIHLTLNQGPIYGVAFLSWSPNSKYLISCGTEDSTDLVIWDATSGEQISRVSYSSEDSLTTASWLHDSQSFVAAGTKGQFYLCDKKGKLLKSWDGVRTQCLSTTRESREVILADTHHRLRRYNFENKKEEQLFQEDNAIMSFSLDKSNKLVLLNVFSQGLHLWDMESRCLVRKFQGLSQFNFTIHSSFGGVNDDFLASGSEDHKVYIFHKNKERPILTLNGHMGSVNCVHWNPVLPCMLASASDDFTIRVWVPKKTSPDSSLSPTPPSSLLPSPPTSAAPSSSSLSSSSSVLFSPSNMNSHMTLTSSS